MPDYQRSLVSIGIVRSHHLIEVALREDQLLTGGGDLGTGSEHLYENNLFRLYGREWFFSVEYVLFHLSEYVGGVEQCAKSLFVSGETIAQLSDLAGWSSDDCQQ